MSYIQEKGANTTGWGGSRVGSGAKPNPQALTVVGAAVMQESAADEEAEDLAMPPADVPVDQQDFWRDYAPLALERQTLTVATVPAFRLLCELHAKKTMVSTIVDKGGLGGLRIYMQLAKQVESLMARFCLAPFGKPARPEKAKKVINPWASIAK